MLTWGERYIDGLLRSALRTTLELGQTRSGPAAQHTADLRLGVVLAAFDATASLAALRALVPIAGEAGRIVVVANSEDAYRSLAGASGLDVLRGSNRAHEFSAYDEGLSHLRQVHKDLEVVVFANDRLSAYRDEFVGLLSGKLLALSRDEQLALGNLDDPGRAFTTPYGTLERYLRGNLVVVPVGALPQDFRMTTVDAARYDALVPRTFDPDHLEAIALKELIADREYAVFLWNWLTTGWYRGGELNRANWPILREKARDILNEHWLTVRLATSGVHPVYAERAAAVAVLQRAVARRKRLNSIIADVHEVGNVRHGDASIHRTARSLTLAIGALVDSAIRKSSSSR